jgi:hypothetical protein
MPGNGKQRAVGIVKPFKENNVLKANECYDRL